MRTVPSKHSPASTKNVSAGTNENAKSHAEPLSQLGNGRIHPPSHSVTAIDETASIAAYSARKNSDQRNPLYSVWKPATSSDSASGRSNGARLVSATMAMANTANAMKSEREELEDEPGLLRVLRFDNADHAQRAGAGLQAGHQHGGDDRQPMAISYDTICALERSEPISG